MANTNLGLLLKQVELYFRVHCEAAADMKGITAGDLQPIKDYVVGQIQELMRVPDHDGDMLYDALMHMRISCLSILKTHYGITAVDCTWVYWSSNLTLHFMPALGYKNSFVPITACLN